MNTNEIKMIPIINLMHHPDNPRKDLGDLSELAESIRVNGILQNLTVVHAIHEMTEDEWMKDAELYQECPTEELRGRLCSRKYEDPNMYWVVIGNRRFEASQKAGLAVLPCVVSDMDHRTQVATMLEENMQRADLTVYEQAQGFQMMMDLGFSQKEISEKTGFSETTVNRRLKMAELDGKIFQKAVGKQITMDDLDRIGQLESVKQRNELLKEFGENNFDWKLNRALKLQKASKVREKAHQMLLDAKVKKVPDKDKYALYGSGYEKLYDRTCELDKWNGKSNFIPKVDGELLYTEDDTDIAFYVKKKKEKAKQVKKSPEELEEQKQIALAWKTAERATEASHELRKNYAGKMKVTPGNAMEMLKWALIAAMAMVFDYDTPTETIRKDDQIPITGYNTQENVANVQKWISSVSQSKWPGIILTMFEGDNSGKRGYADGTRGEKPKYRENRKLDICYQWLKAFDYQMSDEEEQMQKGTHSCFQEAIK